MALATTGLFVTASSAAPSPGVDQQTRDLAARFLRLHRSTPRRLEAARPDADRSGHVNIGGLSHTPESIDYNRERLQKIMLDVRAGRLVTESYVTRAAALTGIPEQALRAFVRVEESRKPPGHFALKIVQAGIEPARALVSDGQAELASAVYSVAYWKALRDRSLLALARRELRRRSGKLGVSPEAFRGVQVPLADWGEHVALLPVERRDQLGDRFVPLAAVGKEPLPMERSPLGPHKWWTGRTTAYLDLAYRGIPKLLDTLYGRNAKRLRIWQAGFEDTSQTFLLAALVDEAMRYKKNADPQMAQFLQRLKIEIVASDHMQRPPRQGRRFQFNDAKVVQFKPKTRLHLRERGAQDEAHAKAELARLERQLGIGLLLGSTGDAPDGDDARYLDALGKLVSAGKIAELLGRVMDVNPRIALVHGSVSFAYDLRPHTWRVRDQVNGGALNTRVRNRLIRFVQSDLTQESAVAKGTADLVLASNVLPYLNTYGGDAQHLPRAIESLARARASGAPLMVESQTAGLLKETIRNPKTAVKELPGPLWVTREGELEATTLDDVRKVSD